MSGFGSAGLRLLYADRGAGEPVVLLHGFTSSFAGTWERTGWVDALAASGRRVLGLEFPGHGGSEPPAAAARCGAERLAEDVLGLLDHVAVAAADLVGFSLGAGVALALAAAHPERVRRVAVGGIGDEALNAIHDTRQVARIAAALENAGAGTADPLGARIRRNAELAGNDPRALLPYLRGRGWPGGLDELGPVVAPLLLFVAEHDEYMRRNDELRRRLSEAEVLLVRGRGHHDVLLDEGLRRRVVAFLDPAGRD